MIGIALKHALPERKYIVEEFFELFKTPWEYIQDGATYEAVLADSVQPQALGEDFWRQCKAVIFTGEEDLPGFKIEEKGVIFGSYEYAKGKQKGIPLLQFNFDLWSICFDLLNHGLSEEEASEPVLDLIIQTMRDFLARHILLIEVLPKPWGVPYSVALTHDVDHLSLREHLRSRTFYGRVRYGLRSVLKNSLGRPFGLKDEWRSFSEVGMQFVNSGIAALRVVFPGLKDPWTSFDRVIEMEDRYGAESSSFYFAQKPGRGIVYSTASEEYEKITSYVSACGREVGVHSMDGWNNLEEARFEYQEQARRSGTKAFGTRVHWLYFDHTSWGCLGEAGFLYDTTFGFNKTVGFRAGTAQVYRPFGADIWELPLHIQDGALYRRNYLSLPPAEATQRALATLRKSASVQGVSTLLWHVKSLSTEYKLWTWTYEALLEQAHRDGAWMTSGRDMVFWFAARRAVRFARGQGSLAVERRSQDPNLESARSCHIRVSSPQGVKDFELKEGSRVELELPTAGTGR